MRRCGLGSTDSFCQSAKEPESAGKCSIFCGLSGPRAVGGMEEDVSLLLVGCSSLRGCGGTSWSGVLGMRSSNLEKDPGRLEPGDDADSTGLGDSWARGALAMRGSKDSEGSGEGRRPRDSCTHGPGES